MYVMYECHVYNRTCRLFQHKSISLQTIARIKVVHIHTIKFSLGTFVHYRTAVHIHTYMYVCMCVPRGTCTRYPVHTYILHEYMYTCKNRKYTFYKLDAKLFITCVPVPVPYQGCV